MNDVAIDAAVTAEMGGVGVESDAVAAGLRNADGIVGDRAVDGEVEDEDAVGAFGDEDFIVVVDVKHLSWVGGEEIGLLGELHQFAVEVGEPVVFEVGVVDQ